MRQSSFVWSRVAHGRIDDGRNHTKILRRVQLELFEIGSKAFDFLR